MKPGKKSIQKHSNHAIHPGLRMLDFVDDGDWRLFHDEPSHPDDERLWRIKLIFHDEPELSGVARLLMALAEGLQAIPDVHVTVGDWGRGTLWAELKIQIGSLAAGKEVEKILSAARDGLLAKWLGSSVTPFRVADHRYGIPSGNGVLLREKSATGGRFHLQHRKEISADQHSQCHARLISGFRGESYERHLVRCDATEAVAPFHVVAGFRIGKTY